MSRRDDSTLAWLLVGYVAYRALVAREVRRRAAAAADKLRELASALPVP